MTLKTHSVHAYMAPNSYSKAWFWEEEVVRHLRLHLPQSSHPSAPQVERRVQGGEGLWKWRHPELPPEVLSLPHNGPQMVK